MTIIAIKRSQSNSAPTLLSNGELAYSYSSDKLFIGQTDTSNSSVSVEYIGGKLLVDKVANLESIIFGGSASISYGALTANTLTLSSISAGSLLRTKTGGVVEGVSGTSGQVMQVAANGMPYFDSLNGGTF
jgi:hypothetical protein